MRHLMNVLDLSVDEINQLISLAETIIEDPTRYSEVCNQAPVPDSVSNQRC